MQNYNFNRIKSKTSYSMTEISSLLGIDRKTCRRWIQNEGLEVIEKNVSPLLIMGSDLIEFVKNKRLKRKKPLEKDEYFCFKCHKVVKAQIGSEQLVKTGKRIGKDNHEQIRKIGSCEICGTKINKYVGVSQQD